MLGIVLILVLSIALTSVLGQGQRQEVDNIEFFQIIEDPENQYGIDEIQIELYNVSAIDRDGRKVYTTTIGRFTDEYDRIVAAAGYPDLQLLANVLQDSKQECTFICESPLIEKDAVVFRDMFPQYRA